MAFDDLPADREPHTCARVLLARMETPEEAEEPPGRLQATTSRLLIKPKSPINALAPAPDSPAKAPRLDAVELLGMLAEQSARSQQSENQDAPPDASSHPLQPRAEARAAGGRAPG